MLLKKKESLAKSEEGLDEQEKIVREELKAADSVLKDANKKLKDAMASASVDRNSLRTADLMLETASAAQQKAMTKLDKIREKQKQVGMKTHKLLDEVLPSTSPSESKLKGSGKRKDRGGDEKGKGRKKLKGK